MPWTACGVIWSMLAITSSSKRSLLPASLASNSIVAYSISIFPETPLLTIYMGDIRCPSDSSILNYLYSAIIHAFEYPMKKVQKRISIIKALD